MQVLSHSHLWAGQSLLSVPLFPALSPGLLLYWPAPTETTLSVHTQCYIVHCHYSKRITLSWIQTWGLYFRSSLTISKCLFSRAHINGLLWSYSTRAITNKYSHTLYYIRHHFPWYWRHSLLAPGSLSPLQCQLSYCDILPAISPR